MFLRTLLSVLCLIQLTGSIVAKEALLTVQANKKADSLLLVEIAGMVQKWTDSCMEKEKTKDNAIICWRDAASAIGQYTSGLSGPLIEEAQRLRLAWLQRVGKLRRVEKMPPNAVAPPAFLFDDTRAELSTSTRSVEQTGRPDRSQTVGRVLESNDTQTMAKRPQESKTQVKSFTMKVIPAASLSQNTRLKEAKPTKEVAFGLDTREASSLRKAKLRAIRQEMKNIAKRLQCLEQSKDIGHLEKCGGPLNR